jgi:hypothetical protein
MNKTKAIFNSAVCSMDIRQTAAFMKAYAVLPPRQSPYMKKVIWAKWLKILFEKISSIR